MTASVLQAEMAAVEVMAGVTLADLPLLLQHRNTPLVLQGLCAHWPLVQAGLLSDEAAADYLLTFDRGEAVGSCYLPPEAKGRIFYNSDYSGFNYQGGQVALPLLLRDLLALKTKPDAPTLYMGSTEINLAFAGLAEHNSFDLSGFSLLDKAAPVKPLTSVWLGNQSRIAAHFDFPHNLACNAVGSRTFTLFGPEQISHLYPGPMEFAPGGQDVSLVDFANPDFNKFPDFAKAIAAGQRVTLSPGDVLFIPSMWWHHVEAHQALNVLITHWWRDTSAYFGRPTNALLHAMLSLRSLPKAQRSAWQAIFNHYIFGHDEQNPADLPEAALGLLQLPLPELTARQLRADLQNKLKR